VTKQGKLGASLAALAIAGVLGYFIVQTMNDQRATRQQLDDLKKQMAAATTPSPATMSGAPTITPSSPAMNSSIATQDVSTLGKQKALQEYLTEGFRLLNTRDPKNVEQAAQIFRDGLDKVDGTNVYFFNGLGRALLLSGKSAEALKVFEDGRKVDPKRAELASGAGWAHWNLKEYYLAKGAWEDAVKLDPNSEDAWMALSWIYLAMSDAEKSKQGFVVLLKIDSTRKDWTFGLAMARASNFSLDQIRAQFKGMPDPAAFQNPATQKTQ
jgi:tetratricopeptide (TPR) repeat protein